MPFVVKIIIGILNYARTNGKFPCGLMTVYGRLLHKKNKSSEYGPEWLSCYFFNGYMFEDIVCYYGKAAFTTPRHNNWGISEGICAY